VTDVRVRPRNRQKRFGPKQYPTSPWVLCEPALAADDASGAASAGYAKHTRSGETLRGYRERPVTLRWTPLAQHLTFLLIVARSRRSEHLCREMNSVILR
jgi:hypothetical protein